MTNTEALKRAISLSGYKLTFVAEQCGITYQAFLNKLNNDTEFKASEIQTLKTLLKLSNKERDRIFFAVNVE